MANAIAPQTWMLDNLRVCSPAYAVFEDAGKGHFNLTTKCGGSECTGTYPHSDFDTVIELFIKSGYKRVR